MKLSVNAEKTITNFSNVMTDRTKVISEMIQNSRRAGASRVDISVETVADDCVNLVVVDDGQGISDFNDLFTLSQSGWNKQVQCSDFPFGMGFLSVLFACESVLIQSNGLQMDVNCVDAFCFNDLGEPSICEVQGCGTRITLRNVKMKAKTVEDKVKDLARYSSIDLYLNNVLQTSHSSLRAFVSKGAEIIHTPFGDMVLNVPFSTSFDVVLQDLRVYSRYDHHNILFSNSLAARMPDRDKLIDEDIVVAEIQDWLKQYFASKLVEIRASMANDVTFLDAYLRPVERFSNEILSEISYLPAEAFEPVCFQVQRSDYTTSSYKHSEGLYRGQTDVLAFESSGYVSEEPVAANFIYFGKCYVTSINLPADHWFLELCHETKESDFEIVCEGATMFSFQGGIAGGNAVVADAISIRHIPTGKVVAVSEDFLSCVAYSFYNNFASMIVDGTPLERPANYAIIKSAGCGIDEALLLQDNSYMDEHDSWLQTELEQDVESFERQLIAATGGDITVVLERLLGTLPTAIVEKLEGKLVNMTTNNGKVSFSIAA